jgi:hypothetical protein
MTCFLCCDYIREPLQSIERVKRMGIQWHTTEKMRMRIKLSVGNSHWKLVVEDELKVSL